MKKLSIGIFAHVDAGKTTLTGIKTMLLSNKFPRESENPWSQSKEKKEFTECAWKMGYTDAQIGTINRLIDGVD